MRCTTCGAELKATTTDLPFKISAAAIVIVKSLPVLECAACPEYLIEDDVARRIDEVLARIDGGAELQVIRYAA